MSNIREVAKIAGVSVATVSRALSHPEKVSQESIAKVKQAIAQVNYRPNMLARNFRSTRSYSLVVLVPEISNPFFSLVIRSIEINAQQRGYSVLLGDTQDSVDREAQYIGLVETHLADGIIQLRPHSHSDSQSLPQPLFPYINLCGTEGTPGPSIRIDNVGAAEHVVDYLISLEHRRIGLITGLPGNPHTLDRMNGYKRALTKADIPFDENLVKEGSFTIWSGVNAANELCKLEQLPTAIVCMNDELAIGAIQAVKSHGYRVPEDISITGFDDIEYSRYCDPPLTTVVQPAEEMGKYAVDDLIRLIQGEKLDSTEHVLPYDFVIRESTAPPRR